MLAKNYGMSAEDFLAAAKTYGGDILKITLLLLPAVIYVAYYFTAFFISFALKPILEVKKVPEFDETVTKKIAGNVVNIRITSRQPGYDSEFAVTPATKWAYLAAIAVLVFGAFFGAGIAGERLRCRICDSSFTALYNSRLQIRILLAETETRRCGDSDNSTLKSYSCGVFACGSDCRYIRTCVYESIRRRLRRKSR